MTFDKTDEKDAVLIARLTSELRCYIPEPVDETWGRLRHLGAPRADDHRESGSQLHAITTTGQAWDPVIATRGKHPRALPAAA